MKHKKRGREIFIKTFHKSIRFLSEYSIRDLSKHFYLCPFCDRWLSSVRKKAILIAAGGLEGWSAGWLQDSPSIQVFPLWGTYFPTKFFPLPMKVLVSQLIPEMGYWSKKKSLKFEQENEFVLKGTLKTFLPVTHIFTRICN